MAHAMVFCPTLTCPASGQPGEGTIRLHACQAQRFLGALCHKRFCATQGTAWDRLHTAVCCMPWSLRSALPSGWWPRGQHALEGMAEPCGRICGVTTRPRTGTRRCAPGQAPQGERVDSPRHAGPSRGWQAR